MTGYPLQPYSLYLLNPHSSSGLICLNFSSKAYFSTRTSYNKTLWLHNFQDGIDLKCQVELLV